MIIDWIATGIMVIGIANNLHSLFTKENTQQLRISSVSIGIAVISLVAIWN